MFVDARRFDEPGLDCDVAIFGAGAAGITIAQALEKASLSVCLIESGGFEIDDTWQDRFDARPIGVPFHPAEGRIRTFGGSTAWWTGRCARLDPDDFAPRPHVANSGWPIGSDALNRFYVEASRIIGFGEGFDTPSPALARLAPHFADNDEIDPFVWRYAAISRDSYQHWGDAYFDRFTESQHIRILIECDLAGIEASDDARRVTTAHVRTRAGQRIDIRARHYVIACGGIENARLLLNFADQAPTLLAEVGDSIGRYFMQHPRAITASVQASPEQAAQLQHLLNQYRRPKGMFDETGFALSTAAQARFELLNGSAILRYRRPELSDPLSGVAPIGQRRFATRLSSEMRPDRLARRMLRRMRGWEQIVADPQILLILDLEQAPDRESRIMLEDARDILGLRRAVIDWRINDLERRTGAFLTKAVCAWFDRTGLGEARPLGRAAEDGGLVPARMLESYHHLGATRMSASPATGVVDADLRVHGTDNLHICGGSVMPTGGHANPTLTITALALRLAEKLEARMSADAAPLQVTGSSSTP